MTLFEQAIIFATNRHKGMVRKKDKSKQYILHPLEVAVIAGTMTDDDAILAAAVLHDTVEDTPTTIEEIYEEFGERVGYLVEMESEDKMIDYPPEDTWIIRKERSIKELIECDDPGVKIIWLSDKLANMRSFYRSLRDEGKDMWLKFNQTDERKQAWYYRKIRDNVQELKGSRAYTEYCELYDKLFEGVEEYE